VELQNFRWVPDVPAAIATIKANGDLVLGPGLSLERALRHVIAKLNEERAAREKAEAENKHLRANPEHVAGCAYLTGESCDCRIRAWIQRDDFLRERDAAIARAEKAERDRQPYPTAWAYEQACKTLQAERARADKLSIENGLIRSELGALEDERTKVAELRAAGEQMAAVLERYQRLSQAFETEGKAALEVWRKAAGK
jgi:DNA repair exonuclease SbcCD ATPase subunit